MGRWADMRRRRWAPWALGGAFVVVGVVGGLIGAAIASPNSSAAPGSSSPVNASAASAASRQVTSVVDKVLPSVVTIAASGAAGSGTGSGEVINSDGYILTNNHVIAGAAQGGSVEVLFSDGVTAPATIVGRDVLTDLAVLKVQPQHDLKAIPLGSSESVVVGQPVIAIGAPLGLSGR
jgi:putative serine protease PepD